MWKKGVHRVLSHLTNLHQHILHLAASYFNTLITLSSLSLSLSLLAALLNTRQVELASACPLLEERRHSSLVDLLTPHADDSCVHLSCCALAALVIQQLQTGALQPRQLPLRGQ